MITIESLWQKYLHDRRLEKMKDHQPSYSLLRETFYAGVVTMMVIIEAIGDPNIPILFSIEQLERIKEELQQFEQSIFDKEVERILNAEIN